MSNKATGLVQPSNLEASPEEQAASQERFGQVLEKWGDGPAAEMDEDELDALIQEEIDADRTEQQSKPMTKKAAASPMPAPEPTTIPPAAFGPGIAKAIEEFQEGLRDPGYTEEELAKIVREEVEAMRAEDQAAERLRKAA